MFFICTLVSAPALSIFSLILKNSKAGSKESKLSLQKANTNYLTTSVRKHSSDKFRREMARKPGSPGRPVVGLKPAVPFSQWLLIRNKCGLLALLHELPRQSRRWQSITRCAVPGGKILAMLNPRFFRYWLQEQIVTSAV